MGTDTIHRIDAAAWRLFTQRGYSRVTMDNLAAELGISKKTLYEVIDGKEALLTRLIRARLAAAEEETAAIVEDRSRTSIQKLRGLVEYSLAQMGTVQPVLLHDIRRQVPALWAEIEATRDRLIDRRLGAVLREGIAAGDLRTDLDPALATAVFFHSLRGVITAHISTANPLQFARLLETTINLLYEGIKPRKE